MLQAEQYSSELPKADNSTQHGSKPHQVFAKTISTLEHLLEGYCLPDPYFKERLDTDINVLLKCLRDPSLPLYELQVLQSY